MKQELHLASCRTDCDSSLWPFGTWLSALHFSPAVLSTYCHTLTPKPDLGSAGRLQLSLSQSGCRHPAPCKSDFHVSILSQCIGRELWFLAPPGARYCVSAAGGKFWVVVFFFQAGSGVLLIDHPLLRSIRPLKRCFRNPAYRMVGLGLCWTSNSRGGERADCILNSARYS